MTGIEREHYARLYGPATGDRIRLADTDLLIEVTEDRSIGAGSGDEAIFGGGKVIRESMGQGMATRAEGTPDLIITGAVWSAICGGHWCRWPAEVRWPPSSPRTP